ncbi:MAG: class I SAM-dependent methyltransferase [Kiritimatiellia bacterium]
MRFLQQVGLADVQAVYSGAEGDLWELIMGQQIHIGGFASSMDLCAKAGIAIQGGHGVDLCCCNGAGMRFLLRFCGVEHMTGVDATPHVLERARARCAAEDMQGKTTFVEADVCATGLPDASMDLVWGEDAWVYVADKAALIKEAARLLKPGATVAFTDWVEGPVPLTEAEAVRFMRFMKFPSLASLEDYRELLQSEELEVIHTENTGRYAPCMDLYLRMLNEQLTSDALRIIAYDLELMKTLGGEMKFIQELAHANKIIQGLYVARKA